ncbi:MAG TPA: pseudouridine synthase, partial [Kofleriaceae bacterium]|nr:pseudouridine synthase [Kofleriaceae bacterium]
MSAPMRLQRFLAQAGVAARRKAEELITAGRVTVDGVVVTELGTKIDPEAANVQVDGEAVAAQERFYIVFNKPKGCITAVTDDRDRVTVMDYLPNLPVKVAPVGRLDYYSEGVLLLTNDGELAAKLLAPGSHVAKTYHVKIRGSLRAGELERLREGVTLDDGTLTMPAEVEPLPGESRHTWLAITLYEGKSRQIHRMLEALGHQVQKLQRVAFANLTFHDLRIGDARELTQAELNDLRELVGLDKSVGARGSWHAQREDTDRARREHLARLEAAAANAAAADLAPADGSPEDDDDEELFERELERARGGPRPSIGAPRSSIPRAASAPRDE